MSASVSWWSEFENGFFSHLSVSAKRCDKSDSVVLGDSSSLSPQKAQALGSGYSLEHMTGQL